MSLANSDLIRVLIALIVLLAVANLGGRLFVSLKQPRVVGEILGGLLLGPTVLGRWAPGLHDWLLPTSGPSSSVLGGVYTMGLLLIMYYMGSEMRGRSRSGERRAVALIAATGTVVPFLLAVVVSLRIDRAGLTGPYGTSTMITLVIGMAVAVTSVPVITRIMSDLGMIRTGFARIVLTVAVVEDVVLYTVLAVVLGVAQTTANTTYGLWALFDNGSPLAAVCYFTAVSVLFVAMLWLILPRVIARLATTRMFGALGADRGNSGLAARLVVLFLLCAGSVALSLDPILGALLAGRCMPERRDTRPSTEDRAANVVGPIYFAIVGAKLNLTHGFDLGFFLVFLVGACVVKLASAWIGARLAGQRGTNATNLAIATNARGGPGIVLASVTYAAGIISENFFAMLILLSIVTSQLAGYWLGRSIARGWLADEIAERTGDGVDERVDEPVPVG